MSRNKSMPNYMRAACKEFIDTFNCDMSLRLWTDLCVEEAKEVLDADTLENSLKEVCDLAYVCTGYTIISDLTGEPPPVLSASEHLLMASAAAISRAVRAWVGDAAFKEAFDRVHKSNMSKVGEDGKPIKREDGKILKGPNYKPPYLKDIVLMAGDPSEEQDRTITIH